MHGKEIRFIFKKSTACTQIKYIVIYIRNNKIQLKYYKAQICSHWEQSVTSYLFAHTSDERQLQVQAILIHNRHLTSQKRKFSSEFQLIEVKYISNVFSVMFF